ncbi:MAG: glycoside hydrolase family 11 protein [Fibrobacteria bacterium]
MLFHTQIPGIRIAFLVIALAAARTHAAQACPTGPALTPGTQHCSSNQTGTIGAFGWSIWSSGSGGCITPAGNTAAFKATWNNSGDFLARAGYQWNETKTYDQYGTISADYAYTKTGTAGGYSFVGIYGWSNTPLVEYYVVDDWFGTGSAPTANGSLKGTFTADSGTYKIYTHQQVNQPSIHGNTTFMQFFSIRQTARQCGRISLTEHFTKWKSLGMDLGKMYEAKLLVEAGGGSGSIDYSVGNFTTGTTALAPFSPNVDSRVAPEIRRNGDLRFANGKGGILSVVSLGGRAIRAARQTPAEPAVIPTGDLPRGLYLLRFQGDAGTPEFRKLLLQKESP